MKRRIPIEQLKPGMHVVGLDLSWIKSPFWIHRGYVKSESEVRKLKQAGIREVTIDSKQDPNIHDTPGRSVIPTDRNVAESVQLNEKADSSADNMGLTEKAEVEPSQAHSFDLGKFEEQLRVAQEVRAQAISSIKRIFEGIKTGVALEAGPLREVTHTLFQCLKAREGCMLADAQLQRMMQFDASLFSHVVDVCVLVLVVGHHTEMPDDQLQDVAIGALLHDVGQLRLPRNLLSKKGTFSSEERNLYLTHPKLGSSIVSRGEDISEASRRVVLEHHERINGSGYPWARKGATISPLSQLVGLVDRYDALVSKRGGRPPLPPALAVRRFYQSGIDGEFAMEWVEKLVQCLGLYPVGSLVELSTAERGWVVAVNQADHMLPTVKLVWAKGREKLSTPHVVELSTYKSNNLPVRVQRVLNPFEEGIQDDLCFIPEMEQVSS